MARALRWDGVVPIALDHLLMPDEIAAYLPPDGRPAGWEVVVNAAPGVPWDDYAAVGATWVVEGNWPEGDWVADLRKLIAAGPRS